MSAIDSKMYSAIPFHIEARHLYRNSDLTEHEVGFGVVGVEKPARVVIASDVYRNPKVIERLSRGGFEFPQRLIDALAIKCFKRMAGMIREQGGDSGWCTVSDISGWVRSQFDHPDDEQILNELSLHVIPGVMAENVCLVADDDAI
jgi:hypothetical protein